MVYISKQAYIDIDLIFIGMLEWNKSELSLEFVDNYIDDIIDECYKLNCLSILTRDIFLINTLVQRFIATNETIELCGMSSTI